MKKKSGTTRMSWGFIVIVVGVMAAIVASATMVFAYKSADIEVGDLTFEIIDRAEEYDDTFNRRGYYIGEDRAGDIYVAVAAGAHSTGGYSISIEKVEIRSDEAHIFVAETEPDRNSVVTMAFTYPTALVRFNKMPKKITVTGKDGEVFERR